MGIGGQHLTIDIRQDIEILQNRRLQAVHMYQRNFLKRCLCTCTTVNKNVYTDGAQYPTYLPSPPRAPE